MTRRPSTIQTTTVSLTSQKTTHDNTAWFDVPTMCETSVSQISRGDLALQKESEESLTRETEGKQRMRADRDGSVTSLGESMSRIGQRHIMRSHSFQTVNEISENTLNEELNKLPSVKNSVRRKFYSTEYNMEIHNVGRKIHNMDYLSHKESLNLRDNSY